jgi:hypothetical protein
MKLLLMEAGTETCMTPDEQMTVVSKRELREFLDKVHLTMTEMMPGIKHLAYHPIKELNEVLIELDQARYVLKEGR